MRLKLPQLARPVGRVAFPGSPNYAFSLGEVLLLLTVVGCASGRPALAAGDSSAGSVSPATTTTTARLQKPDADPASPTVRRTAFETFNQPFPGLPGGQVAVRIRAHVNEAVILDQELRDVAFPLLMQTLNRPEPDRTRVQKEILDRELQGLIDREVILQDLHAKMANMKPQYLDKLKEAAAKEFKRQINQMIANAQRGGANIKTEDQLKDALRAQGMSLDSMRRQKEREFMAMEYMKSRIYSKVDHVSHQDLADYYEQHANEFEVQDSIKWQHIFIDAGKYRSREEARRFAEQLTVRARQGEDFGKLAAQFDNGDSSYRHGEGEGTRRGEIKPPEAESLLFSMHDGEVGPVVEKTNGFHLIRLVHREYAGRRPLNDKVQAEIRKKLQNEVADQEYKRLLADLKRNATIEIVRDTH